MKYYMKCDMWQVYFQYDAFLRLLLDMLQGQAYREIILTFSVSHKTIHFNYVI
jgi:hypothetical protein